jgi:hypothetical protein
MRFSHLIPAFALLLLTSACGDSKEDNQVTETRMDNLDSLEGTISDDMINTDESIEEAPVQMMPEGAEPAGPDTAKSDTPKAPEKATAAADTTKTEASSASK